MRRHLGTLGVLAGVALALLVVLVATLVVVGSHPSETVRHEPEVTTTPSARGPVRTPWLQQVATSVPLGVGLPAVDPYGRAYVVSSRGGYAAPRAWFDTCDGDGEVWHHDDPRPAARMQGDFYDDGFGARRILFVYRTDLAAHDAFLDLMGSGSCRPRLGEQGEESASWFEHRSQTANYPGPRQVVRVGNALLLSSDVSHRDLAARDRLAVHDLCVYAADPCASPRVPAAPTARPGWAPAIPDGVDPSRGLRPSRYARTSPATFSRCTGHGELEDDRVVDVASAEGHTPLSDDEGRRVLLYPDAATARRQMAGLHRSARGCPYTFPAGSTRATAHDFARVRPSNLGDDALLVVRFDAGTGAGGGYDWSRAVRVGSAILVTTTLGHDAFGLEHPRFRLSDIADQGSALAPLIRAMHVFERG